MKHSELFVKRLLEAITDNVHAPLIFAKAPKAVPAFLKSEQGVKALEALSALLQAEADKLEPTQFLNQLEDYAFLFPKKQRDEALKAFDECGDIEIAIHRNEKGAAVRMRKLGTAIPADKRSPGEATQEFNPSGAPAPSAPAPVAESGDAPAPFALLDAQPKQEQAQPATDVIRRKVALLCPTSRDINPSAHMSITAQLISAYDLLGRGEVKYLQQQDTVIDRARNILATRFLDETDCEWSFWMDSDMVAPTGNPAWFKKIAESCGQPCTYSANCLSVSALDRLTQGPRKFVSAVYATRSKHRKHVNQLGLAPKSPAESEFCNSLRHGPRSEFKDLDWVGFGCVAVHRSVFKDVQRVCPELAPQHKGEPWNFFTGELTCSEDVAFCRRATKAGHRPVLDCSVFALHIGNAAFLP